jgi:hypothetical protein
MKKVMKKSVHAFLALPSEVFIVLEMEFGKNIYFGTSKYYTNQVIENKFYKSYTTVLSI